LIKSSKFQYIIVGGGFAEFTVAILLQKFYKKKTALVTGLTGDVTAIPNDFYFPSQFAGQMENHSFVKDISNYLTDDQLIWERLPSVYERHFYPNKIINLSDNLAIYMDQLKKSFNKEKDAVDSFFKDIQDAANYTNFFLLKLFFPKSLHFISEKFFASGKKLSSLSLEEYLESLTANIQLKSSLSGTLQNFASTRESTAFIFHAFNVMNSINGSFAPLGGSESSYNALKISYLNSGGTVFQDYRVNQINIHGNNVRSIDIIQNSNEEINLKANNYFWGLGTNNIPDFIKDFHLNKQLLEKPKVPPLPFPVAFMISMSDEAKKLNTKGEVLRFFPNNSSDSDEIPQACNLYPIFASDTTEQVPLQYLAVIFIQGDTSEEFIEDSIKISDLKKYLNDIIKLHFKEFSENIVSIDFLKNSKLSDNKYFNPFGTVMPSVEKVISQTLKNPLEIKNLFTIGSDLFIPGAASSIMSGIASIGMSLGAFKFFKFFRYLKKKRKKQNSK
jgi:phytoene dehydrogenase-like protein